MTAKKYDIKEHLLDLSINKKDWDPLDDQRCKSYSPFMINRCISTSEMFIPFIRELNKYGFDNKEAHYNAVSSIIPKRKMYFKFMTAKKDKNKDLRVLISQVFNVGTRDTDLILEMMTKEHEIGLREMFGGRRR